MTRLERWAAAATTAFACACTDPSTHVLVGNAFDPGAMCLEPSIGFDIVDGPDPGQCAPTCVVDAKSGATFVTVMCPPYPILDTTTFADASTGAADVCKEALAAWNAEAVCGADAATVDSGSSDAAGDASVHADGA